MYEITKLLNIKKEERIKVDENVQSAIDGINKVYDSNLNIWSQMRDGAGLHILAVLGKNGGTKIFEKEIIRPVADFLAFLNSMNENKDAYIEDVEIDNVDDIYYICIRV